MGLFLSFKIGTVTDPNNDLGKKACINTNHTNTATSIHGLQYANFKCIEEILSRPGDFPQEKQLITSCTSLAEIIISLVNTVSEDLNSLHVTFQNYLSYCST